MGERGEGCRDINGSLSTVWSNDNKNCKRNVGLLEYIVKVSLLSTEEADLGNPAILLVLGVQCHLVVWVKCALNYRICQLQNDYQTLD